MFFRWTQINKSDANFDSPSRILFVFGILTQLPNLVCSTNGRASLILLRNEFHPDENAALAAIRRYGKSALWSRFWSPSGDLGFPAGHNSSLTSNASSSLRASQFIQHPRCHASLLGMIEKHFYPKNQPVTVTSNILLATEKYVKNVLLESNIFCSSNLMKFMYVCILHLLFLIAVIKCYFIIDAKKYTEIKISKELNITRITFLEIKYFKNTRIVERGSGSNYSWNVIFRYNKFFTVS